jgi:hypothetical protein
VLLARLSLMSTVSECQESVIIEVSSNLGVSHNRKLNGTVREYVSKSLTLATSEEIPAFAEIRGQTKNMLFLGHVLSCVPDTEAKWTTHVSVRRRLLVV